MKKILKIVGILILIPFAAALIAGLANKGLGGVIAILALAGGGYYLYQRKRGGQSPSNRSKRSSHQYPELEAFEKQADRAIRTKKGTKLQIPVDLLDNEKWQYLKKKYPTIEARITSEYNSMHLIYKNKFEKLRAPILAGEIPSLDPHEEDRIRPFAAAELPGVELNIVRPEKFKTYIVGLKYHDYMKKEVKEMLELAHLKSWI